MGYAKETALMDLHIFNRIALSIVKTSEFNTVYSFVLLRDFCVVFEEIQNTFAQSIEIDKNIKKIRQNIKLFGKRGSLKNDGVYLKVRKIHEETFESYENNIGIFLDKDSVVGSTIYNAYIFLDSDYENPYLSLHSKEFQNKIRKFLMETIPLTRNELAPFVTSSQEIEFYNNVVPIEMKNSKVIKSFDVRAEAFFNDMQNSVSDQTLKFRLLICLQELNYIIYIYNNFVERHDKEFIDEYTFMRVLTRSLDSILKNLANLKSYSENEYLMWLDELELQLKMQIIEIVDNTNLIEWSSKYRNMVHYDTESKYRFANFYEAALKDSGFKDECFKVFLEVVIPLQKAISNSFLVTKKQQYSLRKMLYLKFKERLNDR